MVPVTLRSLDLGTLVLLRVPGFDLKLQGAWKGPYKIIEWLGEVNYRVEDLKKGHKRKVVHINNIKEYVERTELVGRISIRLRESGIIVPSTSPWSFTLVPVQKPDGTIRVCVDYRKLNQVTKADPHYMPILAEIVDRIGACGVISKLHLTKGYYQVRMKEED